MKTPGRCRAFLFAWHAYTYLRHPRECGDPADFMLGVSAPLRRVRIVLVSPLGESLLSNVGKPNLKEVTKNACPDIRVRQAGLPSHIPTHPEARRREHIPVLTTALATSISHDILCEGLARPSERGVRSARMFLWKSQERSALTLFVGADSSANHTARCFTCRSDGGA